MKNINTLIIGIQILGASMMQAQQFALHSEAPFGIQTMHEDSSRVANKILFFDFDGDGDLDLFLTGNDYVDDFENWEGIHYFIEMQENIGDKWNPQFADRVEPFTDFPFPLGYFFPAIGDVNQDGDPDFAMFGEVNFFGGRTMIYAQNTGGSTAGFDVIRGDMYELEDFVPESFFIPEFVDLDLDGDLDLLMSGFDPAFAVEDGPDVPTYYYARNVGTPTSEPIFQGWYVNPYGLTPNPLAEILTSGDIDNDGDIDLLGAALTIPQDSVNQLYVHLNTPNGAGRPSFGSTLESPFGLPTSFGEEQFFFPELVDMDGDGDLDLFVFQLGVDGTTLQYYENTLCEVSINSLSETICEGDVYSVGSEEFSSAGLYEVLLLTSAGCDSLITLDLSVFEIDNSVTVEGETLRANQDGASYQWINCDTGEDIPGATGQSYEVLVTGSYAVIVTDGADCSESSDCAFVIVTGVSDQRYANSLTIYPNPARDMISIRNETPHPVASIALINIAGQQVGEYRVQDGSPVDISVLECGVYFVKLHLNGEIVLRKLVIL